MHVYYPKTYQVHNMTKFQHAFAYIMLLNFCDLDMIGLTILH